MQRCIRMGKWISWNCTLTPSQTARQALSGACRVGEAEAEQGSGAVTQRYQDSCARMVLIMTVSGLSTGVARRRDLAHFRDHQPTEMGGLVRR
jgi:hypothetical protein